VPSGASSDDEHAGCQSAGQPSSLCRDPATVITCGAAWPLDALNATALNANPTATSTASRRDRNMDDLRWNQPPLRHLSPSGNEPDSGRHERANAQLVQFWQLAGTTVVGGIVIGKVVVGGVVVGGVVVVGGGSGTVDDGGGRSVVVVAGCVVVVVAGAGRVVGGAPVVVGADVLGTVVGDVGTGGNTCGGDPGEVGSVGAGTVVVVATGWGRARGRIRGVGGLGTLASVAAGTAPGALVDGERSAAVEVVGSLLAGGVRVVAAGLVAAGLVGAGAEWGGRPVGGPMIAWRKEEP
jgi:hypothetical protein